MAGRGFEGAGFAPDRASVEQTVHELVAEVTRAGSHSGTSIVVEGPPGMGKSFLAQALLSSLADQPVTLLTLAGERGRRLEPFAGTAQLFDGLPESDDPAETAFDVIDELCASGPVLLCADDAHDLDAATLTVLRRLVWASRNLPLAVLILTRPDASRAILTDLADQATVRLRLPAMDPMRVERLTFDRTGRWPGAALGMILEQAGGNPLYVLELLRAHESAGALQETSADEVDARFALDWRRTDLPEVIHTHLLTLDDPTRELLDALAVWGAQVSIADLASLLEQDQASVVERAQHALASGLVEQDSAGRLRFTHPLFRDVAYAELRDPDREAWHRRAAALLEQGGFRPSLVADHLVRAGAGAVPDSATIEALEKAVTATRLSAPEVTSDLLDDVAAVGSQIPDAMLVEQAQALFNRGRGESAELLIRERIGTVTDLAIAGRMQTLLLISLGNRGAVEAMVEAVERTAAVPGLPPAALHRLQAVRAWVLAQAGRPLSQAELDDLLAEYVRSADAEAEANHSTIVALSAFVDGRLDDALSVWHGHAELSPVSGTVLGRSTAVMLPPTLELASSGPAAARVALDRSRRMARDEESLWLEPILGAIAGIISFVAGDWDDAVAETESALELADETGTGWMSQSVGIQAYIEAHRGNPRSARARLESFRHRGLPLHFGFDRPRWAELAVLEAEGSLDDARTVARTVWAGLRAHPSRFASDVSTDLTRVALAAMDHRLAEQIRDEVADLCSPDISQLVIGMIDSDPEAIADSASQLAVAGRLTIEAAAREELTCAWASNGDRKAALTELEAALDRYQGMGATSDQSRTLARARALGLRRSSRDPHRTARTGWPSLTATELKIVDLVRAGMTNREIGTHLYVSPRTVQTHVSHILRKTDLRSRVEIASAADQA